MGVVFRQGETLSRGSLDLFLSNASGNATNAYSISFAIYYVDPATSAEVLIGPSDRTPVNPAVGEYYASLMIPASAVPGDYRVRWTFQETSISSQQQVVQEFGVVSDSTETSVTLSNCESDLIRKLRIMLRDNCVGGEETVELDVDGERMIIRMDELYEIINS